MDYIDQIAKEIDKVAQSQIQRKRLRTLLDRVTKALRTHSSKGAIEAVQAELDSIVDTADEIAEEISRKIGE